MWNEKPVIVVFGSSRTIDGHDDYEQARRLGSLLARSGYVTCTGGYKGLMEATSQGAVEERGVTLGLTLSVFGDSEANRYVVHEIRNATLFDRLRKFVELADGFIVLKGGIGTLAEVFSIWNLMQTRALGPRPFIFLGDFWPELIAHLREHMEIREKDMRLMDFVSTPEQAVKILKKYLEIKT
jgi:hypothetical protein